LHANEIEIRKQGSEQVVDKRSLADLYASLEKGWKERTSSVRTFALCPNRAHI